MSASVAVIAANVPRATMLATTLGVSCAVFSASDVGDVIRGCAFDVIIIDSEAAIDDDTMADIRPALRSGGSLLNAVTS
ncbi:hypothetical protein [Mycobacterium sp. TY815]|uniref:hypothetical protein n=1 Tax=Mycobacterium sp. TY815 TaxID=3050581 RepID=UPI0027428ABF|nr:hypothetical protein [Mycobacterium sp. TY815]MDP7706813.1 hypothetical protein [Mycobacterium sp. TY815]